MGDWLRSHWDSIAEQLLAGLLLAAVLGAAYWIRKLLRQWVWLWFVLLTMALLAGYAVLWSQYAALRVYITPILALAVGFAAGVAWSRWGARWPLLVRRQSLAKLAREGASWSDSLQAAEVDKRRWQLVESIPKGMVQPSAEGLVTAWTGAGSGHDKSGYLVSLLDLDEGEFSVEFETKVEEPGSVWDAGVNLFVEARPRGPLAAGLRYLPAGGSGDAPNDLVFFVDSDQNPRARVTAPVGEWRRAKIEVSGGKVRAAVGDTVTDWERMSRRPRWLVIGANPVDWHAAGRAGKYVFRHLRVTPNRPRPEGPAEASTTGGEVTEESATLRLARASEELAALEREKQWDADRPEMVITLESVVLYDESDRLFHLLLQNKGPGTALSHGLSAGVEAGGTYWECRIARPPPGSIKPTDRPLTRADVLMPVRAADDPERRDIFVCHYVDTHSTDQRRRVYHSVYDGKTVPPQAYYRPGRPLDERYARVCRACRDQDQQAKS